MVKLIPLTEEETSGSGDYTHACVIDALAGDLTMATANTEQVFDVFNTRDQDQVIKAGVVQSEPFQNTADAAYNTTTIRVGDEDDDDQFVTATEMNKNGANVTKAYGTGDANPTTYSAVKKLRIVIGAQAAKSIVNLNKGRVVVLFKIFRPGPGLKLRGAGGS